MLAEFLSIFGEGPTREIHLLPMDGGVFSSRSSRKACHRFLVLGFLGQREACDFDSVGDGFVALFNGG